MITRQQENGKWVSYSEFCGRRLVTEAATRKLAVWLMWDAMAKTPIPPFPFRPEIVRVQKSAFNDNILKDRDTPL